MNNNYQLTEEEIKHNEYHQAQLYKAMLNNDLQAKAYHRSQIINDPDALMSAKILSGAQWIRDRNYNTTLADRKFGNDWLDK